MINNPISPFTPQPSSFILHPSSFSFRVVDLKQYVYCPRIFYYHTVLPQVRPVTFKMEEGSRAHQVAEGREKRRNLRTYSLESGERYFNVALYSPELNLSGEIDMVIDTGSEVIPVDYKNTRREGPHFRLQLMAYGRLLELANKKEPPVVKRGFLYLIPSRRAIEVRFTPQLRRKVENALAVMITIAQEQSMPPPVKQIARCVDCEFRRFCNDVL